MTQLYTQRVVGNDSSMNHRRHKKITWNKETVISIYQKVGTTPAVLESIHTAILSEIRQLNEDETTEEQKNTSSTKPKLLLFSCIIHDNPKFSFMVLAAPLVEVTSTTVISRHS